MTISSASTLIIPVENQVRELDAKLPWLALRLNGVSRL